MCKKNGGLQYRLTLQLQDIDLFQRSQRGVLRGKVGVRAHRGNDGSGSGGNGGGGDGTSGISASTMLLLARPEKQQIMEAGMEVSPMATTPPLSSSPQGDSAASPSTPSQAQRRLSLSLGGLPGSADRRRGSSADAFTLAAPVTPRT